MDLQPQSPNGQNFPRVGPFSKCSILSILASKFLPALHLTLPV